ncbi:hypothetical protein PBY51_018392 [Eleginops maclovinus]|uniref:FAM20 C-terminal domain-containing protein n=1 Tax=Eleginops maclovinus TaxID=56733 RepID=A0AAN8AXE0_ELEMC|nr:hypothetical protein PBY51_018392 [Eleginops maclovinus]
MMLRMRCRSRTICLSLAFFSIFFHVLLVLVSLPIYQQPCDPLLHPRTNILRELAHSEQSSVGSEGPAETSTERQASSKDASKDASTDASRDAKGGELTLSDGGVSLKGGRFGAMDVAVTERAGRLESDQKKLEALFDHPLYNMPSPSVPEEDRLLKFKPKVQSSEKSSQMWLSASEEDHEDVRWNSSSDSHPPWLRFHLGISRWQLYAHRDQNMAALTQQIATQRVVSAVQKSGGTQLKLVMTFTNYGQALLKPMKQEREEETNYNLYYFSDFERHNAEIAAFHLDRVLGYRRVPPVVGRLVDVVEEIKDVTTDHKLARTFFTSPVGSVCFYGQCSYYCSTEHAVCGRPRQMEASLAVLLPDLSLAPRRTWRSPWRRSYSRSKLAKWQTDPDYCSSVTKTPPYNQGTRLLDFMDMVILDFLMITVATRRLRGYVLTVTVATRRLLGYTLTADRNSTKCFINAEEALPEVQRGLNRHVMKYRESNG